MHATGQRTTTAGAATDCLLSIPSNISPQSLSVLTLKFSGSRGGVAVLEVLVVAGRARDDCLVWGREEEVFAGTLLFEPKENVLPAARREKLYGASGTRGTSCDEPPAEEGRVDEDEYLAEEAELS